MALSVGHSQVPPEPLPLLAPPVPRRLLPVMTGTTFSMTVTEMLSDSGFRPFLPVILAAQPLGTSVSA